VTHGPDAVDVTARILGPRARRDVPLGPLTTYRVGGPAALWAEVGGPDDLAVLSRAVVASGVDVLVVGRGSNLLVADRGFGGLAVVLGERWAEVLVEGARVRAGGAAALPVVARRSAAAGLTGFEWAVGVPGSVGGAVRMNAGGHGSDIAATLAEVRVARLATGEDEVVPAADLDLGYRRSSLAPTDLLLEASFRLRPGDADAAAAEIGEIVRWRREHQPGGQNAGSVFTNPPGDSAGRLLDQAGCHGMREGSASVSDRHANFVQAEPGGSADDVRRLVLRMRDRVAEATGVVLEPELRLVGFAPDPRPEVEG